MLGEPKKSKGIILHTEKCTKWNKTPIVHCILVVHEKNKNCVPYVKMINDSYCSPTRFDISMYNLEFNKEQWLRNQKQNLGGKMR
jgi:hypothetical protein